jgi:geranylgeranyl diphosphate synthase type II
MHSRFQSEFSQSLASFMSDYSASGLYAPVNYLLGLSGKQIRPVLTLSVCNAEGAQISKAMPAAIAVELFHNFTLMHDDIMDNAPLRRGSETVHIKFSENASILSGDVMFSLSSRSIEDIAADHLPAALKLFNATAREVCEGQQLDMEFETTEGVSVDQYFEMIRKKTSVLLAASCSLGAICAGVDSDKVDLWYEFGLNLGLAFQIQDDYLDTFGDSNNTGKQIGGDILSDKKTFLYIHTIAESGAEAFVNAKTMQDEDRVRSVIATMLDAGADIAARNLMNEYSSKALNALRALDLEEVHHIGFEDLLSSVTDRIS